MPATKVSYPFWNAATEVAAGKTKAAPLVSFTLDARSFYGGEIYWRIVNKGALAKPCIILFQVSSDGADWYDHWRVSSDDLLAGTISQGPTIPAPRGARYLRAIAYGNETSACDVQASVDMLTAL